MNQSTPMIFMPHTGLQYPISNRKACEFRKSFTRTIFKYDPWTGEKRNPADIESDPFGLLITPPSEPLFTIEREEDSPLVQLEIGLVKDLIDYGLSGKVAEPWMVEQLQTALQKAETEK